MNDYNHYLKAVCPLLLLMIISILNNGCSACETLSKINTMVDAYTDLAGNIDDFLDDLLDDIKDNLTDSVPFKPDDAVNFPPVQPDVEGWINPQEELIGHTGSITTDIDSDNCLEDVTVFVEDITNMIYFSWLGDECSDDLGTCWLSWIDSNATKWFISSACENPEGSVICWYRGSMLTCISCNNDGQCNQCDTNQPSCDWPGAGEVGNYNIRIVEDSYPIIDGDQDITDIDLDTSDGDTPADGDQNPDDDEDPAIDGDMDTIDGDYPTDGDATDSDTINGDGAGGSAGNIWKDNDTGLVWQNQAANK